MSRKLFIKVYTKCIYLNDRFRIEQKPLINITFFSF